MRIRIDKGDWAMDIFNRAVRCCIVVVLVGQTACVTSRGAEYSRELHFPSGRRPGYGEADLSPDERTLLLWGKYHDTPVTLWDVMTGRQVAAIGDARQVPGETKLSVPKWQGGYAEFHPGGQTVLIGSQSGASIWDARVGKPVLRLHRAARADLRGERRGKFSPDGRLVYLEKVAGDKSAGGGAGIWDANTGRRLTNLEVGAWRDFFFTPDGRRLAYVTCYGQLTVVDTSNGKAVLVREGPVLFPELMRLRKELAKGRLPEAAKAIGVSSKTFKDSGPRGLAVHPDGTQIAVAYGFTDTSIAASLVRLADGERLHHFNLCSPRLPAFTLDDFYEGEDYRREPIILRFSRDGKRLLSGFRKTLILWDTASGREVTRWETKGPLQFAKLIDQDRRLLTLAREETGGSTITIWDAKTPRRLHSAPLLGPPISTLSFGSFSPTGEHLVLGHSNGTAVWDLRLGALLHHIPLARPPCAWTRDGKKLFARTGKFLKGPDGYTQAGESFVGEWDVTTAERRRAFEVPYPTQGESGGRSPYDFADGIRVTSLAYCFEENRLAATCIPNKRPAEFVMGWDLVSGKRTSFLPATKWHSDFVAAGFDALGHLNVLRKPEETLILYDVDEDRKVREFRSVESKVALTATYAVFSRDLRHVLVWPGLWTGKRPAGDPALSGGSDAVLFDVQKGEAARALSGHESWSTSAAFSPDGRFLATGLFDKTIRIWEVATGTEIRVLRGHKDFPKSLCYSRDGRRLLSVSRKAAIIWDVAAAKPLVRLMMMDGGREWLAVTASGFFHGSELGRRRLGWRISGQVFPMELYAQRLHRPDVVSAAMLGRPLNVATGITPGHDPPKVHLAVTGIDARSMTLTATARPGSPKRTISGIRLLVDGRDHPFLEENLQSKEVHPDGRMTLRWRVAFPPGKTKAVLAALAEDDEGLTSLPAVEVVVRPGPTTAIERTLYVLSIGVSKYRNPKSDLRFADQDARRLSELLEKQEGKAFHRVETRVLLNEDATRAKIHEALQWLSENCRWQDTAIVHFSGHGGRDPRGRLYYLPHDADSARPNDTLVPWDHVAAELKRVRGAAVLFLVDCCHSGAFGMNAASQDDLATLLVREARVMVFTASRGLELSVELKKLGHGAFTYAILNGLRGAADLIPDGRITVSELQAYVANRVKQITEDKQHPHLPLIQDFDPADPTFFYVWSKTRNPVC